MHRLRHGPILATLVRLAVPNVLAMVLTVLVGIAETYYVGRLGTTPLASVLRGTGNMRVPSITIVLAAVLQIALGGLLGLGAGPVPSFGMVGVAVGHIVATTAMVAVLGWFLVSGGARVTLAWHGWRFDTALLADILRVGALSCVSPVMSVLSVLIFTGLIAHVGVLPLAGCAIGQRLEFLLVPIAFGIGVASVPMVGMAIGAGDVARARRVAWTSGGVSALNLALIGGTVAWWPDLWASLFTTDAAVLEHARQYLRTVGPAFPLFGLGLTLYFASQGSGRVLGPVLAGVLRLLLVAAVGAWLAGRAATPAAYFMLVAGAMAAYGLATALAVRLTPWGTDRRPRP